MCDAGSPWRQGEPASASRLAAIVSKPWDPFLDYSPGCEAKPSPDFHMYEGHGCQELQTSEGRAGSKLAHANHCFESSSSVAVLGTVQMVGQGELDQARSS